MEDNNDRKIFNNIFGCMFNGCSCFGCLLLPLIILCAIMALMTPMMAIDKIISDIGNAVEETVENIGDTVEEAVENIGDTWEKFTNFITLHGWNSDEESFHKELRDEYETYKEKGIILDTRLIQSILFYDSAVDEDEDYSCDLPEDADEGDFASCIPGQGDYDYGQLRDEVHDLVDGMFDGNALKSEEDFNEWLKDNFIEDKLDSLGYTIPEDDTAKERMFDEFIDVVYQKKGLYEELLGEEENNFQCTLTQTPNGDSKQKARYTVYSDGPDAGRSLGATGNIDKYMKEGIIYINDKGYYMWKGGSKGRNGNVYGSPGTDYLIVAASTKAKDVLGKYSKTCKTTFKVFDDIRYFAYGDTFTVQVTTDKGKTYDTYNSIVLDTCGACMLWSNSVDSPCTRPKSLVKETNNLKIDIYVHKGDNYQRPGDIGYFLDGTSSNVCVGTIDLGVLEPGTSKTKSLNKPIAEVLGNQGIQELNQQIRSNVQKYGKGTGNAVAAAAITLINGLKQKGYHLPYFFGGGHNLGIAEGVDQRWGSPSTIDSSWFAYNAGHGRYIYSYDCSGFVNWSMYQAGCPRSTAQTSSIVSGKPVKKRKNINEAQPGDILNDLGSHVMLVVQNNGGKVTLAESTTSGIQFSEPTAKKIAGYDIIDMSEYYKQYCHG